MPPAAILLLVTSALLHALWNLVLKQAGEKYLATWWAVLLGSALSLPVLLLTGPPARETWIWIGVSALLETAYFAALSAAYVDSEFSLVYPIARGAAPALIALWGILLLGEAPSAAGALGLLVVVIGLLMIGLTGQAARGQPAGSRPLRSMGLALVIAVLISVYSTVDGTVVKRAPALPYIIPVFFLTAVFTAPFVLRRYGWPRAIAAWREEGWRLPLIGILNVGAYLIALGAFAIAPIGYSGAIREVSVVFGALAGWRFLGEQMGIRRVLGAAVVFAGILLIAIRG